MKGRGQSKLPSTNLPVGGTTPISGYDFVSTKALVTSSFANSVATPAQFVPYGLPHDCFIVPLSYNYRWMDHCAPISRTAPALTTASPISATIPFAIHSSRLVFWLIQTTRTTCVGIVQASHPTVSALRPLCAYTWRGIALMQLPLNSVGTQSWSQHIYGTASKLLVLHYKRRFWPVISSSLHAIYLFSTPPTVTLSGTLLPEHSSLVLPNSVLPPLHSSSLDPSDSESSGATQ
jgi:hypothetical protein